MSNHHVLHLLLLICSVCIYVDAYTYVCTVELLPTEGRYIYVIQITKHRIITAVVTQPTMGVCARSEVAAEVCI